MNHSLLDVLSVWWIKVVIDVFVVYLFLKVAKGSDKNHEKHTSDQT
jgi:hypothetical protein|tara:strand:+ start:182 stop:319 length:138 start_codon:yes stop_codon:yes gene_type:complete